MERIRRAFLRFDAGFLVVAVLCLLAVWPFISRQALPQATDAELHIFRLAELSRLVRAGELFPRWAPNFYFGYGYPIFNYYAPLTYYLGLGIDFMPVLGPVDAVKGLFIAGLFGAGMGMYGYLRDLWGRIAGLIGATAYVYAPYILFVDPHARGDLAEAFSFALFPLALWAMDKLRRRPTAWNWAASVILLSSVILSHNLMAMVFFGLIAGWVIWEGVTRGSKLNFESNIGYLTLLIRLRLVLVLILAVGVSAFFWLPVTLEQEAVNLSSLIGDGSHFDFRQHFPSLVELLSPSKIIDWGASEPEYRLNIGLIQWLLALLGIVAIILSWIKGRLHAAYFAVVGAGLFFLMLPISSFIWESLPLLPYLQFPWRLLGAFAAAMSILAGVGFASLNERLPEKARIWIPALVVGLLLLSALPLIQIPPWPVDFGPTTAARVLQEEVAGRWLGTTATSDFVPASVDLVPKSRRSIREDILSNRPIDRVNHETLPDGTTVVSEQLTPLSFRYIVTGESDFLLRLFLFRFPGWQAKIDGSLVGINRARPEGFIVIPTPAGDHVIEVTFRNTPARTLAAVISLISLLLMIIVTLVLYRKLSLADFRLEERDSSEKRMSTQLWLIFGVALVLTVANAILIEPSGMLRNESTGLDAIPAANKIAADFGGQIYLIGYDVPDKLLSPGESFDFTAYWKAQGKPEINYQVFLHLFDSENNLVAQSDKLNPGDFPTARWPADKYVRDHHKIALPSELSPGEYRISIGLWVQEEGWRLPLIDQDGIQIDDRFFLPQPLIVR